MYETVDQLPDNIQADCTPQEQAEYLRVYNLVFKQTQAADKATAAAWGWVRKMRMTGVSIMKSAPNGDPIIGGWAMHFAFNRDDVDSYETHFSRASRLLLEYYQGAPLWMEHGQDKDYGADPVGRRDHAGIYGFGVWLGHTVHRNHPRFEETHQGVEDGEFSYSSDSIGHYVEGGFNPITGELGDWPFAGCSLTRSPAETALGLVGFRSFYNALKSAVQHKQQTGSEAREARRSGERKFFFVSDKQGAFSMTPEMLAALAEFLGVEATPEAVGAALQDLLTQLQASPTEPAAQTAQADMVTSIAPAMGLPATAQKSEVIAKLQAVAAMLGEAEDGKGKGRKLNVGALKRFASLSQEALDDTPEDEEDIIPFYLGDNGDDDEDEEETNHRSFRSRRNNRQVSFSHNRKSKKPGLMDVIAGITQVQGGPIQFEMPAFKSRRTSGAAALRSMNIINAQSGGWQLNRELSNELLEALYANLVLEQLGAKVVPMDGIESLTMNRVQSGAVSYWAGTGQTVTDANAKVRAAVTLNTKELVSKAIIENKLLNNSGGSSVESMVEEDIRKVMKRRMELSAFYGTGSVPVATGNSGAEPLGLKNITGITSTDLGSAAPKLSDLIDAEGAIEDANLDYDDLMWLSSKRARRFFKKMKAAGSSQPLFSEDWITNDIRALIVQDHAFLTTTQVPNTTDGDVTTTDIFLGAWENFLIGQGLDLEMVVDTSRYVEERSTLIQIVSYVDYGVAYKEAFHILENAKV